MAHGAGLDNRWGKPHRRSNLLLSAFFQLASGAEGEFGSGPIYCFFGVIDNIQILPQKWDISHYLDFSSERSSSDFDLRLKKR